MDGGVFARELAKRSRRDYEQQQQQQQSTAAAAAAAAVSAPARAAAVASASSPVRAARSVPLVPVLRSCLDGVEQPADLQLARVNFSPSPTPPPAPAAATAASGTAADAGAATMSDIPVDPAASSSEPAAAASPDDSKRCLVRLPAQAQPDASLSTQECTRKICCTSVPCPPGAPFVDVYFSKHQPENEHFEADQSEVERQLRVQLRAVDDELRDLTKRKQQVDHHIHVLHSYNEIKDVVQSLMGKCAELEGKRITEMYEKFGLELDD